MVQSRVKATVYLERFWQNGLQLIYSHVWFTHGSPASSKATVAWNRTAKGILVPHETISPKKTGIFSLFTSVFLVPTIVLGIWCVQLLFLLPGGISVKKIIFGFELPSITITTSKLHKAPLNSGRVNMTGIICLALKQQIWGFSGGASGKEATCQCSRH